MMEIFYGRNLGRDIAGWLGAGKARRAGLLPKRRMVQEQVVSSRDSASDPGCGGCAIAYPPYSEALPPAR
jgi:hypothetical protein